MLFRRGLRLGELVLPQLTGWAHRKFSPVLQPDIGQLWSHLSPCNLLLRHARLDVQVRMLISHTSTALRPSCQPSSRKCFVWAGAVQSYYLYQIAYGAWQDARWILESRAGRGTAAPFRYRRGTDCAGRQEAVNSGFHHGELSLSPAW